MTTIDLRENLDTPVWEGVSARRQQWWRVEGYIRRHLDWFIISALFVIGVGIRMWVSRGFWLDEATSVTEARMGFFRMLSYLRTSDVHPPLFQSILWVDIRVFGSSEFAARLPSLIFGSALIPVVYATAKELFDRRVGLIAALICTLAPVEIWYSQEARMYPEFMMAATLAIWAQVRCLRSNSRKAWVAYTVSSGLLLWTQYFTFLQVLVQQAAFVILFWKERHNEYGRSLRRNWMYSVFGLVLFVAPLAPFPYGQITHYGLRDTTTVQTNGSVASGAPLYTAISNLSSALIGYHSDAIMEKINALWPFAMLIALLSLGRGRSRVTLLLVSLVFVPLGVLFVIGLKRNDVFELRYFATAVPVSTILIARAITLVTKRTVPLVVTLLLVCSVLGAAIADEQLDGGNDHVFDFRSVLRAANTQEQPGDLMLYEPFYLHPVISYYAPRFTSLPLVAGLTSTTEPKRIFIVDSFSFAEKAQSEQRVDQVVNRLKQDRHLVKHVQQNQVEIWEFQ
jgi:4-amino-4-deoxy-L-arabinose transferase-like glycosyltransferase